PLCMASFGGGVVPPDREVEIMDILVAKGADVNDKCQNGQTPLIWAASTGHVDRMEFLLAHGANIHAKDAVQKADALYAALAGGQLQAAQFLIGKGFS